MSVCRRAPAVWTCPHGDEPCVSSGGPGAPVCVPGMCGVRGWQPKPAPPAPATPGSNPCSSSSQATPWTQMQVVRGRGSRATDGALYPTPTAPRQVGLIPLGPCQPVLPQHRTHPGPDLTARNPHPRPASPGFSVYLCAPSHPFPCSALRL